MTYVPHSFGMSNAGNTSGTSGTVSNQIIFAGGNNITLSQSTNASGSATVTVSSPNMFKAGMSNAGNTSGTSGTVSNQIVLAGGDNITLSQSTAAGGNTITISGATAVGAYSAGMSNIGNTSGTSGTVASQVVLAGGNNMTLSQSVNGGSATITMSAGGGGGAVSNAIQSVSTATGSGTNTSRFAADDHVHAGVYAVGVSNLSNDSGNTAVLPGRLVLAGGNNITLSQSSSNNNNMTVTISAGAGGGASAQAFAPYQLLTGSAVSSHVTNSYWFNYVRIPEDLALSKVNVVKSFNYGLPGATSQASAGSNTWQLSHSLTVFKRSNYAANSSQIASVVNASMGMTFAHSHTSNQASLKVSFVTDSTGGTTSWSTASTGNAHSSYWTGLKFVQIPLVTTLTAGEYWVAFAHNSSQTTNNSNYTQASVSNLYQGMQVNTVGGFGSNGSYAYIGLHGGVMGQGPASGTTNTMSLSAISANSQHYFYHNYQNLPVTTTP